MRKSSTKPKGATSFKETALGIMPHSKLVTLEIDGVKRGLEWLYNTLKQGKEIKINPELICKLHETCFLWIFPEWAGKYRTIQVTYSGKEAPHSSQIPELILNLCEDLSVRLDHLSNKDEKKFPLHVITLLSWFQHRFVVIHPFQDYNGRIARMLTMLILLKLQLPPAEIQIERDVDRKKYLRAMQKADEGNYLQLEQLLTDAIIEALDNTE